MENNSWERMWAAGLPRGAAFDGNGASPALTAFLDARPAPPAGATALVPGCGRAYDAVALAAKGYTVSAWDISRTAVDEARKLVAEAPPEVGARVAVVRRDFFDVAQDQDGQTFDLIWDCTFLCALPPESRAAWAARSASLLRKDTSGEGAGGELVSLVFPVFPPTHPKVTGGSGPPFALTCDLVKSLLVGPQGLAVKEQVDPLPVSARHVVGGFGASGGPGSSLLVFGHGASAEKIR